MTIMERPLLAQSCRSRACLFIRGRTDMPNRWDEVAFWADLGHQAAWTCVEGCPSSDRAHRGRIGNEAAGVARAYRRRSCTCSNVVRKLRECFQFRSVTLRPLFLILL